LPIEPKNSVTGGVFRFDPSASGGTPASERGGESWTAYGAEIWAVRGLNEDVAGDWVYDVLVAPDGTLWFGTDYGVLQFDGEVWTIYATWAGLVSNQVRCITLAPDGALWIGTNGGVSRYAPPE
jgi:ligand-binding sensor domain-containing protein